MAEQRAAHDRMFNRTRREVETREVERAKSSGCGIHSYHFSLQ